MIKDGSMADYRNGGNMAYYWDGSMVYYQLEE